MRFLFLEPFFGGSHRDFAEGLAEHSRHRIDLLTLPARFWKWRMRGAALHFARKTEATLSGYDGLITSDLMSLADFRAIAGPGVPPALVYFHENQLTYPLRPGERPDFQYGFTNITTALAAEGVVFNSRTHFDAFFDRLPGFLQMMPDTVPRWAVERIRGRSSVLHPGCRFPSGGAGEGGPPESEPPLVIWNHRWEFDKNPESFFEALTAVAEQGIDFRIALLGENFRNVPPVFRTARKRFGDRIIQYGYLPEKSDYCDMLARGTVVVSTAWQENFGISVVEAVRYGCMPLLPDRLSYPEIIPPAFHGDCLYRDDRDLVEKLCRILRDPQTFQTLRRQLSRAMAAFAWERMIHTYDTLLEDLVHNCRERRR